MNPNPNQPNRSLTPTVVPQMSEFDAENASTGGLNDSVKVDMEPAANR